MPSGTYEFGPGGSMGTAQTEGINVPSVGMPGAGGMDDFFKKALMEQYERRKVQQAMEDRMAKSNEAAFNNQRAAAAKAQASFVPINRAYDNPVPRGAGGGGGGGERPYDQLVDQQRGNQAEQMMLDRLPAATRMVHGPGIISGQTMDPMAMNAASRQKYLPQNVGSAQDRTAGSDIGGSEFARIGQGNADRLRDPYGNLDFDRQELDARRASDRRR